MVGAEIGYSHMNSMQSAAADSEGRQFKTSDGYYNDVTVTGQSTVKLVDYATLRARAGYAFGQFLPYAVLGAAVGRFNYATTARVQATGTDVSGGGGAPYSLDQTETDSQNNVFVAGVEVGLDVAVTPNVFLRGEWDYIAFANFHGIQNAMNTGRVGIGLRFWRPPATGQVPASQRS